MSWVSSSASTPQPEMKCERRRRMYLNIWDAVSENMEGRQSDLFEEIGVETDEAVGEVLSTYQKLLTKNKRPRI